MISDVEHLFMCLFGHLLVFFPKANQWKYRAPLTFFIYTYFYLNIAVSTLTPMCLLHFYTETAKKFLKKKIIQLSTLFLQINCLWPWLGPLYHSLIFFFLVLGQFFLHCHGHYSKSGTLAEASIQWSLFPSLSHLNKNTEAVKHNFLAPLAIPSCSPQSYLYSYSSLSSLRKWFFPFLLLKANLLS